MLYGHKVRPNSIEHLSSICICLEIFLTCLSGKMERERRVPLTATGTNPGSEFTFYLCFQCNSVNVSMTEMAWNKYMLCPACNESYKRLIKCQIRNRTTALRWRTSKSNMLMLVSSSEWSSSERQASPWESASSGVEGWAAGWAMERWWGAFLSSTSWRTVLPDRTGPWRLETGS